MTRDELRAHLDRRPPRNPNHITWRTWFQPYDGGPDEAYLGQRSARTGPDRVRATQKCTCDVCANGRQAAKVFPGTQIATQTDPDTAYDP